MAGMRIGVVGAGIIGLAVARRLTELRPDATVTVFEKEHELALHQTGRNSGVVHAGIYYPPGSLKAQLCRRGVGLLQAYCAEREIPLVECGKLVVALDESELERLRELERRAARERRARHPLGRGRRAARDRAARAGIAGLHSPTTGDHRLPGCRAGVRRRRSGGRRLRVYSGPRCARSRPRQATARVATGDDELEFDLLVICAGLQSDRVARLRRRRAEPTIVPFRGEYYRLTAEREQLVRGLVYPVPDPAYPFLGVHFTRRVHGGVDVGPNAVLAFAREGYRRRDVRLGDLAETLRPAASGRSRGSTGGWAHTSCAARSQQAGVRRRGAPLRPRGVGRRPRAAHRQASARRPSTRTARSSTTSASTGSARSPPSATHRRPAPRRAWRSPSTSRNRH